MGKGSVDCDDNDRKMNRGYNTNTSYISSLDPEDL